MRVVRLGVWAAGVALCTAMFVGAIRGPVLSTATGNMYDPSHDPAYAGFILALVTVTLGTLVWERRADSRTGILLVAFAIAGVLTDPIVFPGSRLAVTVGLAASVWLILAIAGHLLLAYPTGRFTSRIDRGFVAVVYGFALVGALPVLLFFDPRTPHDPAVTECDGCALPLTHVAWRDVNGLRSILNAVGVGLIVLFIALLLRKIVRAVPVARSVALPLAVVAFIAAARFTALLVLRLAAPSASVSWSSGWDWSGMLVGLAIVITLASGMLWGGAGRGAVADLVVELEGTPGSVRDALARALGDPSLELALWLPDRSAYVDRTGRPLELPATGSGRAVTVLGPAEAPLAALVHDPALLERPRLLQASGAAARLALENERLQAELRAQLLELRSSRARIVSAGDEERRRLERDLHDGAQQRLLSLGLALQLVRARLGEGANGTTGLLDEAEGELRAALDELRELARGIHPAVLTEQGLPAALKTLAERSPVPVTIAGLPGQRLAPPAEAAAYFLVSEAIANVAKHARASRVRVHLTQAAGLMLIDVDDDGVGGADPSRGSGLRGLADRVHALDGRLELESPQGRGTHLHAELPCV